ncbi:PRD domain-containing protein [Boudabousia marimammalium]|uniref:PRD domain-containing protein n=1 Tax=Boudabousia marimammalium TaxID=156892 RepID=A0A1Q5PSH4_9ACTO|nr:PRD domain-containing protein [Boudabousia marimammalium]OKL50483.1 hypothetical protein BM477_00465 [Boudabousia marimammalium]
MVTFDEQLQARSALFRKNASIPDGIVDIVEQLFHRGYFGTYCTDKNMGFLFSHLVAALTRNNEGDNSLEGLSQSQVDEILEKEPTVEKDVEDITKFLFEEHDISLPNEEKGYLMLHLAALKHKERNNP